MKPIFGTSTFTAYNQKRINKKHVELTNKFALLFSPIEISL